MNDFPISMAQPPRPAIAQPEACDVVIIGGGIIGVMTAWFLAEQGQRVTLCEKGRIGGEQSSRNWGWIRQQGRDLDELPIMVESLRIWKSLVQECGEALGFRQEGTLYLARSEAEMAEFEAWLVHARAHRLDTHMMNRAEVGAKLGSDVWLGGLFTPSDARAEPWVAVPTLVEGAVRRGVTVLEGCAVRRLDIAAGRVAGVMTEQGRIACDQVVLAGGAWSSLFAAAHGVRFPQLSVLSSVAQTEPMPEIFPGNAADDLFAFRRRIDGGYTISPGTDRDFFLGPDAFRNFSAYLPILKRDFRSTRCKPKAPAGYPDAWGTQRSWQADEVSPFEAIRVLNPAPNMAALRRAQADFARAFPHLGHPKLQSVWAGMIDTMPDMVPVVDRVATMPGLVLATGMSGHGFGIGPGMGRVIADLVLGNETGHDLNRFRHSRFSDGTKLAPGPTL